jgi:hypothetical protein
MVSPVEGEVEAALSDNDLPLQRLKTRELGNPALKKSFLHHGVGAKGVDVYPRAARANKFPGVGELASRMIASREEHLGPGLRQSQHPTRIRAMRYDHLSVVQLDIR